MVCNVLAEVRRNLRGCYCPEQCRFMIRATQTAEQRP